jgi:hypothetical protein
MARGTCPVSLLSRLAAAFDEAKRRKVFQAGATYAVVAWVILQLGEVTFEPLHFPDWALTLLVVLVIVGFPCAMVLAWFFDLTLHGFIKDTGSWMQAAEVVAAAQAETASITYRLAFGPNAGKKALTLKRLPATVETGHHDEQVSKRAGFALHAGVACKAGQGKKRERLCRYITRPAIAERGGRLRIITGKGRQCHC